MDAINTPVLKRTEQENFILRDNFEMSDSPKCCELVSISSVTTWQSLFCSVFLPMMDCENNYNKTCSGTGQ